MGETASASLYLRLLIDAAACQRTSCAIIFLDVVAAFAQMLRRIVFNVDAGDEAWLASLAAAGFGEEDIEAIYHNICDSDWVQAMLNNDSSDISSSPVPLDYKYMEQSFVNSWVSQEYIPNVLEVTKGSCAGTPLADLVYSMAMSRVLTYLRSSLTSQDIASSISIGGVSHDVVDVSFVDDVAIPVFAPAAGLVDKAGRIVQCAFHVFLLYGMTLNFKPNKSEGIVGFFGTNSRKARVELFKAHSRTSIDAGESSWFRFVSVYQHVGTSISVDLSMSCEVTKRCGMMRSEARSLSHKILRCSGISLLQKVLVMQAYIISKGTFQCGTWAALPDVQYKRFHKCIMDIYRTICGKFYKPHGGDNAVDVASIFSDDDVIYQHGFINPRTMLRVSKLIFFAGIVKKSPPLLLDLILA